MRVLYFDAFSGVSGDMTVGALLQLGVELRRIEAELATLPLPGYRLAATDRSVHGIRACKFDVEVGVMPSTLQQRSFRDIHAALNLSGLQPAAREKAVGIFTRLAEAEGRVHGVATEDVAFHEIGAVDSIVDIVAAAVGLAELQIERVYVSSLPLGSGTVSSRHGIIPVPAPATVELLKGFPVRMGDGAGELVTPTGAAIVAALAVPGEPLPTMQVEGVGYGAGARSLADRPNVLRLVLGLAAGQAASDEMVVLETNIDDSNPEIYEYVMEQLFAAGARDVWLSAAQMKKNRPGTLLHVLVEPAGRHAMAAIILRETSAIGVRFHSVQRLIVPREEVTVETEFGAVPVKMSHSPDGTVNMAPEYEACKRLARERGVPLKLVYQAAAAAARQRRSATGKP